MPYSFLHIAALRNDVVKAQLLIDGEAPDDVHVWKSQPIEHRGGNFIPVFVDERDASGWTPLMCAATHGHLEMCRALVEREADINLKKNFKCTALHLAAHGGHGDVVEYLVMNNADIMAKKLDHCTPFHDAVLGGHIEVAKILFQSMKLEMDAFKILGMTNDHKRTALHLASKRGHPDMCRWLISEGSSLTAKDSDGQTPLNLAPNRRTLVAFPGHIDPVDISVQTVGACSLELEEMKKLNIDENGKLLPPTNSPAKAGHMRRQGANKDLLGRPTTSDVGNYTSSLGILHDDIGKDTFSRNLQLE